MTTSGTEYRQTKSRQNRRCTNYELWAVKSARSTNNDLFTEREPIYRYAARRANSRRVGRGLKAAGERYPNVVGLCADLERACRCTCLPKHFLTDISRWISLSTNLPIIASGLACAGKIPFAASYAAFSPGRNWEQIKTTTALNEQPVKMVGAHAGVTVGPDGATHQMLEDIALMRVMPNMVVVCPGDSVEAEKATMAIADL